MQKEKSTMTSGLLAKLMRNELSNLRLRDEVVVLWREMELVVAGQFWRGLHHDLLELLERRRPCLVRELPSRNLEHGDAKAPHIRAYVVGGGVPLRIDTLRLKIWHGADSIRSFYNKLQQRLLVSKRSYRHVRLAPSIDGLRYRVHKVSRDSKVTHLHVAVAGDEYVRWLHIAMYHL